MDNLLEFFERMFVGPVWPASVLVGLLCLYTIVALIGLIDLNWGIDGGIDVDGPSLEAGPDLEVGPEWDAGPVGGPGADGLDGTSGPQGGGDPLGGVGAATVRWLNLQRLPLIVWMSVFTVFFWMVSYFLWHAFDVRRYEPTWWPSVGLTLRNGVLAIVATKFVTTPLNRLFEPPPAFGADQLIGKTCVVSTGVVDATFGQGRFATDAAPLLLNIRTDGDSLPRGSIVQIIAYDAERRLYTVAATNTGEPS